MLLRCIVVTGKTSVGRLTSLTAYIIAADLTGTVFYVTRASALRTKHLPGNTSPQTSVTFHRRVREIFVGQGVQ